MKLENCKKYIKKLIGSLITSYAIYLCFKRNKGVNRHLIIAFMFSHMYILYALAVPVREIKKIEKEIIYLNKK